MERRVMATDPARHGARRDQPDRLSAVHRHPATGRAGPRSDGARRSRLSAQVVPPVWPLVDANKDAI